MVDIIYRSRSITQGNANLNRYVCEVAHVDEVPCGEDVVQHSIKRFHVRITRRTTVTHWSIIAENLNMRGYYFKTPPLLMVVLFSLLIWLFVRVINYVA